MNSKSTLATDLGFPLPARQFQGFLLFFHVVFLVALGATLLSHFARIHSPQSEDWMLAFLVGAQAALYVFCFALPSLFPGLRSFVWFRNVARKLPAGFHPSDKLALGFWALYISSSIALALAEARINRAFEWTLIAYIGQISAFPLRLSIPATLGIATAWLSNRFGWSALAGWPPRAWIELFMTALPMLALVFFMGRMVVTSAERGRLILELEAAKRELELARDREVELATLRERERLARDLHDSLGHSLVTLTVQLEAAQRLLPADAGRAGSLLAEMQKLTRSSMEDLRRSLACLRAPGLGERSLSAAVREFCEQENQKSGTTVACQISGEVDVLPPPVAEALWRVVQEGMTNVQKHARAKRANVSLTAGPGEVLLSVADDGVGLAKEPEAVPGHFGLRGLRERIEGLGGSFVAEENNGGGSRLTARIPIVA